MNFTNTKSRAIQQEQIKGLWYKIKEYQIDDLTSDFKFSDRLQRENFWTKEYTLRVIEEYKKFIFLACTKPPVTPSIDVDECWHLHMIYTKDYWHNFCRDTLKKEIHHGPTKGGQKEDIKYEDLYNKTLKFYNLYFGKHPEDIWPPAKIRFAETEIVKFDLLKHWVIPVGDFKGLWKAIKQYFKTKLKK